MEISAAVPMVYRLSAVWIVLTLACYLSPWIAPAYRIPQTGTSGPPQDKIASLAAVRADKMGSDHLAE